jgi:nucleotide-binding universal stress UspA family protein
MDLTDQVDVPNEPAAEGERVFLVVIDNSEEMSVAISFAAHRAARLAGRVALCVAMESAEPDPWMSVEELIRAEKLEEAEEALRYWGGVVRERTGRLPIVFVREGVPADEITRLVQDEESISILILASANGEAPGPIITKLVSKGLRLRTPVTLVPGGITDADIARIA